MLQMVIFSLSLLILSVSQAVQAFPVPVPGAIYHKGLSQTSLQEALKSVQPGQVVVIGEAHGTSVMASQQVQVLKTLRKMGYSVSLGMEFFASKYQEQVDQYRLGQLPESEFLTAIEWGQGFPFDFYREQVLFPQVGAEYVVALNAARSFTGKIVKVGLEGLSDEEKSLLPPGFSLGNKKYFERFKNAMSGPHMPTGEALDRYFAAQSVWDDTMAFQASQFLQKHPEQVLVIIVGEFHVQYGGGLPERLALRGLKPITFSLVNLEGLSESERLSEVQPNEENGVRADFVWTSQFPLDP